MSGYEFSGVRMEQTDTGGALEGQTVVIIGKQAGATAHPVTEINATPEQWRSCARWVDENLGTKEERDTLRAKCFVMSRELGFTDKDRHEISIMVVGAERSPSWAQFSYADIQRLADYLTGLGAGIVILRDRLEDVGIKYRARKAVGA